MEILNSVTKHQNGTKLSSFVPYITGIIMMHKNRYIFEKITKIKAVQFEHFIFLFSTQLMTNTPVSHLVHIIVCEIQ